MAGPGAHPRSQVADATVPAIGTLTHGSGGRTMSEPGDAQPEGAFAPDEALGRIEDVLLGLPFDRAVPELDDLLAAAGVDHEVLRDERVRKLLHEALVARPFGSLDAVQHVRTEVELLTLEVELLTDRLGAPGTAPDELTRSTRRLVAIRARLAELRGQL
jgi:hypothetical protein